MAVEGEEVCLQLFELLMVEKCTIYLLKTSGTLELALKSKFQFQIAFFISICKGFKMTGLLMIANVHFILIKYDRLNSTLLLYSYTSYL